MESAKLRSVVTAVIVAMSITIMIIGTYISYNFSFYLGLATVFVGASLLIISALREKIE